MRYEIKGETLPVVVCYLEDGEQMITERGSMSWMSPNMKMDTNARGGLGNLQPGQQIVVDTGYLAAMTASCQMEIQTVPGVKNMVFGGEGIFNTVITGPGHIWLQTMPLSNVAGVLRPYFPSSSN